MLVKTARSIQLLHSYTIMTHTSIIATPARLCSDGIIAEIRSKIRNGRYEGTIAFMEDVVWEESIQDEIVRTVTEFLETNGYEIKMWPEELGNRYFVQAIVNVTEDMKESASNLILTHVENIVKSGKLSGEFYVYNIPCWDIPCWERFNQDDHIKDICRNVSEKNGNNWKFKKFVILRDWISFTVSVPFKKRKTQATEALLEKISYYMQAGLLHRNILLTFFDELEDNEKIEIFNDVTKQLETHGWKVDYLGFTRGLLWGKWNHECEFKVVPGQSTLEELPTYVP